MCLNNWKCEKSLSLKWEVAYCTGLLDTHHACCYAAFVVFMDVSTVLCKETSGGRKSITMMPLPNLVEQVVSVYICIENGNKVYAPLKCLGTN